MEEDKRLDGLEDEIDLYELLFIILKNKVIVISVAIIITLLALGAALYVRNNSHNRYAVNFSNVYSNDNHFFLEKSGIIFEKNYAENILKDDNIVKKIFENNNIKDLYLKSTSKDSKDISIMRGFLSKRIKIVISDKDKKLPIQTGILELDFLGDRKLSSEIGDLLFKTYNEEFFNLIYNKINLKYNFVYQEREKAAKSLEDMDKKIKEIMYSEFGNKYENLDPDKIISMKYPKFYNDMKNVEEIYKKYNNELIGLDGFKNEKENKVILNKTSSYYTIEVKSKAKIILLVGVIVAIIAGIFSAFIKEFLDEYKKRYN